MRSIVEGHARGSERLKHFTLAEARSRRGSCTMPHGSTRYRMSRQLEKINSAPLRPSASAQISLPHREETGLAPSVRRTRLAPAC